MQHVGQDAQDAAGVVTGAQAEERAVAVAEPLAHAADQDVRGLVPELVGRGARVLAGDVEAPVPADLCAVRATAG